MYEKYFKRPLDFTLSLIALIFLSPILLITALIVRIKLGSPVLFKQERPGLNEEIFEMYKFRTMTDERDINGELLPNNQRHTKFGEKLRSMSLDELPELLNILKGEMSIVGPRPLLIRYLPRYNDFQRQRHNIKPGLTGYAQVNGRNSTTWDSRLKNDVYYVKNISFILDIKIIIKTILIVIKKDGVNKKEGDTMSEFIGESLNNDKN